MVRSSNVSGGDGGDANSKIFNPKKKSFVSTTIALMISFATFNIRGLGFQQENNQHSKRELLGLDCEKYHVDICALQETKVTESDSLVLRNGFNLFLFEQLDSRHGGLGFIISPRMMNYVVCWKYISDRVCYVDICIPSRSGTPLRCRVINAYCPHQGLVRKNPAVLDNFYGQLREAKNVSSNVELQFLGDFNSKLGKLSPPDIEQGIGRYMGKYGMGVRNENGSRLLDFISENDLFAANTSFIHPSRHVTSFTGWRKDWSAGRLSKKTLPVYSQIDYILCRNRSKCLLSQSRTYAGTKTFSDHKLVIARINFNNIHLCFKPKQRRVPSYNISELVSNKDMQHKYHLALDGKFSNFRTSNDPNADLQNLMSHIRDAANVSIGPKPKARLKHHSSDDTLKELVDKRHDLRQLLNNNQSLDRSTLRSSINHLTNSIQSRLVEVRSAQADQTYSEITNTNDSRKMFEAVRHLQKSKPPNNSIGVHDEDGCLIASDDMKASVVRDYLEKQLTRDEQPLEPFEGLPRALIIPFTGVEIHAATSSLKNGRANGPDGIPNELIKYSNSTVHEHYAGIINSCFETHTFPISIGEATITPLQKPKKPIGPLKNLRPLTLSNAARKILSMATLKRIEEKVNAFTGPWQCAYKRARSCADIVWCQRVLLSVVQRKKWEYHRMGIDMSSAFDTIKRTTILELLKLCGCTEDELRIVRLLLSNTKLRVKVNGVLSAEFLSLLGAFQGDCLSGCLFTLVLAGALNELRWTITISLDRPIPPITIAGLPLDTEYADDVDFNDEEEDNLRAILPQATAILKKWNLFVNEDKTDFTHVYLARTGEVDSDGNLLSGNEAWRKSITLGSVLCSKADIQRRINLGYAAFNNYKKAWSDKLPLNKRLILYNALVVSVLMYNSSCWAVPKIFLEKLDVVHRRHLRTILNIEYPGVISNINLYKRCNAEPLSEKVARSRWRMLGHVLRGPVDGPAFSSLIFAINTLDLPGRRGRPQSNLFSLIVHDLCKRNMYINNIYDLFYLRNLAYDKRYWQKLQ